MKTISKMVSMLAMVIILASCGTKEEDPTPAIPQEQVSKVKGTWSYEATQHNVIAAFVIKVDKDGIHSVDSIAIQVDGEYQIITSNRITQPNKETNTIDEIAFTSDNFSLVFNTLTLLDDGKSMFIAIPTYTIMDQTTFEDGGQLIKK